MNRSRATCILLVLAPMIGVCGAPRDSGIGCLEATGLEELVSLALPPEVREGGMGIDGAWPVRDRPPGLARELRERSTDLPTHIAMEFHFEVAIPRIEEFRSKLCDRLEEALEDSCGGVHRNNRYLACTFQVESGDRTGVLEVLPDRLEASGRTLILVADEW